MPSLNLNNGSFRANFLESLNDPSLQLPGVNASSSVVKTLESESIPERIEGYIDLCLPKKHKSAVTPDDVKSYAQVAFAIHAHFLRAEHKRRELGLFNTEETCKSSHQYIWTALRLCYEHCAQENLADIARSLIEEVLFCDEDLGAIFGFLDKWDCHHSPVDVLYYSESEDSQQNLYALEYFLSVGLTDTRECRNSTYSLGKKTIMKNSGSFLNDAACFTRSTLPLCLAAMSVDAEATLLLLRYGADPLAPGKDHLLNEPSGENAISILISSLNCLAFAKGMCFTQEAQSVLRVDVEKILLCLKYILRVLRVLPIVSSSSPNAPILWTGDLRTPEVLTVPAEFWSDFCDHGLVGVPSLQHQCRLTIRQTLDQTVTQRTLPDLITSLPLPGRLKHFIDLKQE